MATLVCTPTTAASGYIVKTIDEAGPHYTGHFPDASATCGIQVFDEWGLYGTDPLEEWRGFLTFDVDLPGGATIESFRLEVSSITVAGDEADQDFYAEVADYDAGDLPASWASYIAGITPAGDPPTAIDWLIDSGDSGFDELVLRAVAGTVGFKFRDHAAHTTARTWTIPVSTATLTITYHPAPGVTLTSSRALDGTLESTAADGVTLTSGRATGETLTSGRGTGSTLTSGIATGGTLTSSLASASTLDSGLVPEE